MIASERLYLDHAATTPVLAAAQAAFAQGLAGWANPSSPHLDGRSARAALEQARSDVAHALGWPHHVIFTSGASEAIAIALGRAECNAIAVSPTEHDAVLRAAGDNAQRLAVDLNGQIVLASLSRPLDEGRALIAVQHVNNETGVIQPLDEIAQRVHEAGGLLLADCAQSAGKLALPDADFIAISAHKFGGPPGVGALLIKDLASLRAIGGQEQGYRPGTENLPGAMAMAAALAENRSWLDRAADLRRQLDRLIDDAGGEVVAKAVPRAPTIASYRMPGVNAVTQLIRFDREGVAVSAGSACSSGSIRPSHVLTAMGWDGANAGEVIRVSFGPSTSRANIYRFAELWADIAGSMGR